MTADEAKIIAEYVQKLVNPESAKVETEQQEGVSVVEVTPAVAPALAAVIEKAVTAAKMGAEVTAEKVAEITYCFIQ